jgi:hypothetical protein
MMSRVFKGTHGRALLGASLVLAAGVFAQGCLDRPLKPLNPCLVSGVVAEIAVTNIDKVDLLFVVDNSGSMREEQVSLQREFPKLINVLTTGLRLDPNGNPAIDPKTGMPYEPFPPAENLHLGVVSSDMGLVGIPGIPGCDGLGDDGIMNNIPDTAVGGCMASYPRFISYLAGVNDAATTANDFGCIASLGTEGCGFEQQLEAALKGLWPSVDTDPETGATYEPNRVLFLGDSMGFGQLGHGDVENAGFLRNDIQMGISLIAIILVSDEEDCSSADTSHFLPDVYLDPNDPAQAELAMQDLNLRCYYNKQNLYDLRRYAPTIEGEPGHPSPGAFRALRPGNEQLVIFAAIVGVPPDVIDNSIDVDDDQARNAYYGDILAHPAMQETPDTTLPPGEGNLIPSCINDADGDGTAESRAYPPRRIVEVAQRFGPQGVVQSICTSDFSPAMNAIIDVIAKQLGAVCLPRALVRNSEGMVGCNVVWELPPPGKAQTNTPTDCSMKGFLSTPDEGRATTSSEGGQVCKVNQLPVSQQDLANGTEPQGGEGWYYDDFSEGVRKDCSATTPQRIAFSDQARPPTGVTVKLECLNETQSLSNNRQDILTTVEQPTIGDSCTDEAGAPDNMLCAVTLANGQSDTAMFCHPENNVCVLRCTSDADCPPAWVCDTGGETKLGRDAMSISTICVNPTCGDTGG